MKRRNTAYFKSLPVLKVKVAIAADGNYNKQYQNEDVLYFFDFKLTVYQSVVLKVNFIGKTC